MLIHRTTWLLNLHKYIENFNLFMLSAIRNPYEKKGFRSKPIFLWVLMNRTKYPKKLGIIVWAVLSINKIKIRFVERQTVIHGIIQIL